MSRIITKRFEAVQLLNDLSCAELNESGVQGDSTFNVDDPPLKIFPNSDETVKDIDGVTDIAVVRFSSGSYSYCVRSSTFYECTKPAVERT
jgi:hypothetical protein